MEDKSQHFLLTKQARTLSTRRIHRLTEKQAFAEFVAIRFAANGGTPFCPWCGHRHVYAITTRKTWKCSSKVCRRNFSATSRTIFASRKLSYQTLLLIIAELVKPAKGASAIWLSHQLEVTYKTAFVWYHKMREAMTTEQHSGKLRGLVEIDGAYFGGHVRPRNHRPKQVDRRRLPHKSSKRKCVVVMRERYGRSRAFVCSESDGASRVPQVVEPGSAIYTDEGPQYNRIAARYVLKMVNHSERYADGDASTNWAESYFSRLRRAEMGTHHHVAGPYLTGYANEACWREDHRRCGTQEKFDDLLRITTNHPVSRQWKGYWQRRKAA